MNENKTAISDYRAKFMEIISADKYNMLKYLYRKTLVYNRTISIVFSNLEKNKLWKPSENYKNAGDEFVEELISSCILNLLMEYDSGEVLPIINAETLSILSQLVEELNYVIDNNKDYIEEKLKYHIFPKVNPDDYSGIDKMFNISRDKIDDMYTDIVRIDIYDIIGTFMSHDMSSFLEYLKGVIHPRKDRFKNVTEVFSENSDFYSKVIKTVRSEDSYVVFSSYYNVDMESALNTLKIAVAELTVIYNNYGDIIQSRYEKEFGMKIDTDTETEESEESENQQESVSEDNNLAVEDNDTDDVVFDDSDVSDETVETVESAEAESEELPSSEETSDTASDEEISDTENEIEGFVDMKNSESINKLTKIIGSCYFCGGYEKFVTDLLNDTCRAMTTCKDEKILENVRRWYRIVAQEVVPDLTIEDDDIDFIVARMILIDFKSEFSKFSFDEMDSHEIFASDYFNDCLGSLICSFGGEIPEYDNAVNTMIECLAVIASNSNAYAKKFITKELDKISYSEERKDTPSEYFNSRLEKISHE